MKLLFLKGAEHELCRFAFTWGVFSPSPPHSSKPAVFCFSSTLSFGLFNSSSHLKRFYLLFFPHFISCLLKKTVSLPLSSPACCPTTANITPAPSLPPRAPHTSPVLLSAAPTNPFSISLSLSWCYTHAHRHTLLSLFLCVCAHFFQWMECWAEEWGRKKRGPVLLQWYWIHISVWNKRCGSIAVCHLPPLLKFPPLKKPMTNVQNKP